MSENKKTQVGLIYAARHTLGMSREEFGQWLGRYCRKTVMRWETGCRTPNWNVMRRCWDVVAPKLAHTVYYRSRSARWELETPETLAEWFSEMLGPPGVGAKRPEPGAKRPAPEPSHRSPSDGLVSTAVKAKGMTPEQFGVWLARTVGRDAPVSRQAVHSWITRRTVPQGRHLAVCEAVARRVAAVRVRQLAEAAGRSPAYDSRRLEGDIEAVLEECLGVWPANTDVGGWNEL